jgi:hypothetical protein
MALVNLSQKQQMPKKNVEEDTKMKRKAKHNENTDEGERGKSCTKMMPLSMLWRG